MEIKERADAGDMEQNQEGQHGKRDKVTSMMVERGEMPRKYPRFAVIKIDDLSGTKISLL